MACVVVYALCTLARWLSLGVWRRFGARALRGIATTSTGFITTAGGLVLSEG